MWHQRRLPASIAFHAGMLIHDLSPSCSPYLGKRIAKICSGTEDGAQDAFTGSYWKGSSLFSMEWEERRPPTARSDRRRPHRRLHVAPLIGDQRGDVESPAAILIMAKTLGEQAVSAPSSL